MEFVGCQPNPNSFLYILFEVEKSSAQGFVYTKLHHIKVTQINYVLRNQLHHTANGCQYSNFGLGAQIQISFY
jgi:hypothetical protein